MNDNTMERFNWCLEYLKKQKKEFTPFKHQWETVSFCLQQDNMRCLVSDDQGLGKTLSGLMVVSSLQAWYKSKGEEVDIYVVAPISVKENWYKEARKIVCKMEVFSYAKPPDVRNIIRPYILITDEIGHYAQNLKSTRTQKLLNLSLSSRCYGLVALSGTPMKNGRPSNLFPILKMMQHPLGLGSKSFYEKRYCNAHPTQFTAWDTSGASNLIELNAKISNKIIRHLKEECLDLPEKIYNEVTCEKNAERSSEYDERLDNLINDWHRRVESREISPASKAMVFMGFFRQLSSIYKHYTSIEVAEGLLEQGYPVVIFTDFVESATRIADHFDVPVLSGKSVNRQQMVDDFQTGLTKVFVGTIKAGGVGVTLTRAQYMIMNDKPWTSSDYVQACDRIHRIGQKGNCCIYYDIFGKDIDYVMAALIRHKHDNIEKVLKKLRISLDDTQSENPPFEKIAEALLRFS